MNPRHLLFSSLLLAGCATADLGTAAGYVLQPSRTMMVSGDSEWVPASREEEECIAALARSLKRKNLKIADYYVRFAAVVRNGTRIVEGQGSHVRHTDASTYLKPVSREVEDEIAFLGPHGGGSLYFRFTYDADKRRITECEVNAPL